VAVPHGILAQPDQELQIKALSAALIQTPEAQIKVLAVVVALVQVAAQLQQKLVQMAAMELIQILPAPV
jgi:hypothetical protein